VSENWTTIRGCGVLDMPGAVELSPDAERVAVLIRQELCITSGDRASVKRIDLGKFPAVHHAQGRYIAWSPAGGQLAVALGRQEVKLIDAATGDTIRTFGNRPEKGRLYYHLPRPVCFSPDGARLAVPDVDGSLVVWEVSTGKEFLRHQSAAVIGELTFSHDGARIGVGLHGGGFEVIDAADGRIILSRPPVSDSSVGAVVSFSPDGRLMAVGTPVHMELWQLPGLRRKATLLLPFYRHAPASNICDRPVIGFSGDGGTVAVLAGEMLTLIDSGSVVVRHQYRFQSVLVATFDPGWKRLAVLSSGGLRMWEVPEEMRLATVQE